MERLQIPRRQLFKVVASVVGGAVLAGSGLEKIVEALTPEPQLNVEVLMYHNVTSRKLINDLTYRLDQGYQPVCPEIFNWGLKGDVPIPPGYFMLTLDDSRLSQYQAVTEAVDYIQKTRDWFVPAVFFVLTKFDDIRLEIKDIPGETPSYRSDDINDVHMTKDQLLYLLNQGHYLENHTINHANLLRVNRGVMEDEVVNGEKRVQALWDIAEKEKKIKIFAYPNGAYKDLQGKDEPLKLISALNYDLAFSERQTTTHTFSDRLILGRKSMT